MKKFLAWTLAALICLGMFAGCDSTGKQEGTGGSALEDAKNYLYAMYKDEAEATPADYERVAAVKVDGVTYSITWTADVTEGQATDVTVTAADGTVKIDVNEKTEAEVKYSLKATLSDAEGNTKEISFAHSIPAYKEFGWEDYAAASDGTTVVVKGVVTGLIAKSKGNSSNAIYFQDSTGGFYVYNLSTDPVTDNGLAEGMKIQVTGTRSTYSGTYEITDSTVEILDSTPNIPAAADYTELFKSAASLKDTALVSKQGLLVTIKGVEISAETDSDISSGYYKFKLGNLESYIRISSSVCPLIKDDQTKFKDGHKSHTGWIANATGVICLYDGAFYLTPVTADAFEYVSLPEKSDAEKVAFEKENLSFTSNITADGTFDLIATGASYSTVAITWASDNACAVVKDGKLTATLPDAETTVKLTATLKCGSTTDTKVFEIKVDAASYTTYTVTRVDTPVKDTAYKLGFEQVNVNKKLYFTGEMSGNYYATAENVAKAADVFVEEVNGGYRLYFLKDGKKTYLDIYEYTSGKAGLQLTEAPTATYTYDTTAKTFFTEVAGTAYYMGTYNNYETVSTSKTSYITGDNAAKVDVSQFPVHLWKAEEVAPAAPVKATELKAGVSYKLYMSQALAGKELYFTGEMSGNYLATSDKSAKGVDIILEEANGGWRMSFTYGGKKQYIEIYEYTSGKAGIQLVETPTMNYTWNAELGILTAAVAGSDRYLGTYKTYETVSASATSYITGTNASSVGVSQFPAYLVTLG